MSKQFAALKAGGVKLYYVGCGVKDQLAYTGSQALVELLKKQGFNYTFNETPGGHSWFNCAFTWPTSLPNCSAEKQTY